MAKKSELDTLQVKSKCRKPINNIEKAAENFLFKIDTAIKKLNRIKEKYILNEKNEEEFNKISGRAVIMRSEFYKLKKENLDEECPGDDSLDYSYPK